MKSRFFYAIVVCPLFFLFAGTPTRAQVVIDNYSRIGQNEGSFNGSLNAGDSFGASAEEWGDYNDDGVMDLVIGAPGDNAKGAVWILFMTDSRTVSDSRKIAEGESGFTGPLSANARFGASITNVGDLDGNQVNDLAVGAPGNGESGTVSLLFMDSLGMVIHSLMIGDSLSGFTGELALDDHFGSSLGFISDLNNDAYGELLVGASGDDDGMDNSGAVWVLALDSADTVTSIQKISNTVLGDTLETESYFGLALLSDANDLFVGASGSNSVWKITLDSTGAVSSYEQYMTSDQDGFGSAIEIINDVDGDGDGDMAIGASVAGTLTIVFTEISTPELIESNVGCFDADLDSLDAFGSSLLFTNNVVMAGAPGDDLQGIDVGVAWVLEIGYNSPPVADAGEDQVHECTGTLTEVTLDASGTVDPDGDFLNYTWSWSGGELYGSVQTVELPVGSHLFVLTVGDACRGASDTDSVSVTIEDTVPPEISIRDKDIYLWPPNHKLHNIEISSMIKEVFDLCDTALSIDDVKIGSVTSDEPANDNGDGNTEEDIFISEDCASVDLRAERQGGENGRVYRINLWLQDASGNVGTGSFKVMVPHDMGKGKKDIVEDSVMYEVFGCEPIPPDTTTSETDTTTATGNGDEGTNTGDSTSTVSQNYPNPFSMRTNIRFRLIREEQVKIEIYNLSGTKVSEFTSKVYPEGEHEVIFDAQGLEPGVYIYHFVHNGKRVVKKMYLVR